MKMKAGLFVVGLAIASICTCIAQPPPNDDFANATVLTGNDVTFAGTLYNATIDSRGHEAYGYPFFQNVLIGHSVWWSWTAPQDGPVVLTLTSTSPDPYSFQPAMFVYSITNDINLDSDGNNLFPPGTIAGLAVRPSILQSSLVFNATNGSNYQFQLMDQNYGFAGNSSTNPTYSVTFHLVATNTPVILQAPVNQTVRPGQSALFTVVAEGVRPLFYQWCFNGTSLPQQNMTMLPLDNIPLDQAGAYTVIISNSTGVVTSAPVMLTVAPNIAPPVLTAIDSTSNSFAFSLAAEQGRYFRIISSTDLTNWSSENIFPIWPMLYGGLFSGSPFGSVLFVSNSPIACTILQTNRPKFFRVKSYFPTNEICNNNLKQIRLAKMLWFRDLFPYNYNVTELPRYSDLTNYLPNLTTLVCPEDIDDSYFTSYILNSAGVNPGCQYNHLLEEP